MTDNTDDESLTVDADDAQVLAQLRELWEKGFIQPTNFPIVTIDEETPDAASAHSSPNRKRRSNAAVGRIDVSMLPKEVREQLFQFMRWILARTNR